MNSLLLALVIFLLRIINNAVSTIRVVYIARQQKFIAAVLGWLESAIFAFTVATVVTGLSDPLIFMAYTVGYAVGSYAGMALEERLIKSFATVNIFTQTDGRLIAEALRTAGFGVTETSGEGRAGRVSMLYATVDRRDTGQVINIVREYNPDAFISIDETRSIRAGYMPAHGRRLT